MDAKTMRAALAAAVRVTVSTSLIGCGGQVTSDAGVPTTPHAEGGEPARYVVSSDAGRASRNGGGGMSAGGGTMLADAGEPATGVAGAPALGGCEAIDACMKSLAGLDFDDALPDAAAERCCATIIEGLSTIAPEEMNECRFQLGSDFFSLPAHRACCNTVLGAWGNQACTPWGPPVPPALPSAALETWRLAA